MARRVEIRTEITLEDYGSYAHLSPAVRELEAEARLLVPRLEDRTVWMVNSTARGGGVAEMLPTMVGLLRQLGIPTEWVVIESDDPDFFTLTKRIHNLIHGEGDPGFDDGHRALYERVAEENAAQLRKWISPGDIVIIHDPQPMALASFLAEDPDPVLIWRCHIGLDESNAATKGVWEFLRPYAGDYRTAVFSAPEYIPEIFPGATVIYPAIDPLTRKNRELSIHRLCGILENSALSAALGPVVTPRYPHVAHRVSPEGDTVPADSMGDLGLLNRPVVAQVSRWDRLKGFAWVLEAFVKVKRLLHGGDGMEPVHRRRLELARLVLAGPDPTAVEDDPEGQEVFAELAARYAELDPGLQEDIAVVSLPMASRAENALMVNALQRTSSVVVQNSLREGFGLTVAEAMWKRIPVLSNSQACGPRQQIRDGIDGRLAEDPTDADELARLLNQMLAKHEARDTWGRTAQRRAYDEFLIFAQIRKWLRVLVEQV
ncbi:MAG: glycosyltransferase [Longimicrobiales bacterium]|nr:glycosyltransferase [Longimicrobiales bacterium]